MSQVATTAGRLRNAVAAVDFGQVQAALRDLSIVLETFPNPAVVTTDVDKFKAVLTALPCMRALIQQIGIVNRTVRVPWGWLSLGWRWYLTTSWLMC